MKEKDEALTSVEKKVLFFKKLHKGYSLTQAETEVVKEERFLDERKKIHKCLFCL